MEQRWEDISAFQIYKPLYSPAPVNTQELGGGGRYSANPSYQQA